MTSEQRAVELRGALARSERRGAGLPYPESLRREAVAYWRERQMQGGSLRQVASELGVSGITLGRWSRREAEGTSGFRAIEVVAGAVRRESWPVVHGPRGVRVEGLTVAEIAELFERLS